MQSNNVQKTHSNEGVHKMGSTELDSKYARNLRLVEVGKQGAETSRIPSGSADSAESDKKLENRVIELERQVMLLQQQLEMERKLAQIDPLTGIANRRAFDSRLKSEVARSERSGSPLSLVVWDIDHFKKINDNYGHPFGDDVIRCVAQVIETHLRQCDFTARYGGEEFVAILPDCDVHGARIIAQKISREIQRSGICLNIVDMELTVSCGIATHRGCDRDETLFKRADDALYRAKVTGRNRVVVEGD